MLCLITIRTPSCHPPDILNSGDVERRSLSGLGTPHLRADGCA